MIASTVGFLTIVLALWTWRVDPRHRVRTLAFVALGAVIVQGLLGGITVLLRLPPAVSIGHASLAQLFFCLTVALAQLTSPAWRAAGRSTPPDDDLRLARLAVATTALVYAQIVAGATMRHLNAGLAIPDFPLVFGGLLPPAWSAAVTVHYLHRIGAMVVTLLVLATAWHVWNAHGGAWLRRPALLLLFLVGVQVTLGAFVILTGLQPVVNTAHVVNGALVLATSLVLTLRSSQRTIDGFLAGETIGSVSAPTATVHAPASLR
jgi:cytochrome c oxidase assembly protein subunit 15